MLLDLVWTFSYEEISPFSNEPIQGPQVRKQLSLYAYWLESSSYDCSFQSFPYFIMQCLNLLYSLFILKPWFAFNAPWNPVSWSQGINTIDYFERR